MNGSEKQIAWAIELKAKFLEIAEKLIKQPPFNEEEKMLIAEENKYYDLIKDIDDASFWIGVKSTICYSDFSPEYTYKLAVRRALIKA